MRIDSLHEFLQLGAAPAPASHLLSNRNGSRSHTYNPSVPPASTIQGVQCIIHEHEKPEFEPSSLLGYLVKLQNHLNTSLFICTMGIITESGSLDNFKINLIMYEKHLAP
jgi:hypothetical protein